MKNILSIILFITIFNSGCTDRSELTAPILPGKDLWGTADFTTFVSIGNSVTAGVQGNAVYESGQVTNFVSLIRQQAGIATENFTQPIYSEPGSGGRVEIVSVSPFLTRVNPKRGSIKNPNIALPYNNLGIPGARLYDILNASSTETSELYNPRPGQRKQTNIMYTEILRGKGTQFQQAKILKPTFMTLWIGNNDALHYGLNGGSVDCEFTPIATFDVWYKQMVDSIAKLNDGKIKVLVGNIPDITAVPFFTTVGSTLKNSLGLQKVYITTNSGQIKLQPIDSILITLYGASEALGGKGMAPGNPISDISVLDVEEVIKLRNVIIEYNKIIKREADRKGFLLLDIYTSFNETKKNGYKTNGLTLTADYFTGGIFSLDGFHPSTRGQGILANEMIKIINEKWNANLQLVDISLLPGSYIVATGVSTEITPQRKKEMLISISESLKKHPIQ